MKKRQCIAFLMAAVATIGAITAGTILLLKNNEKPTDALTAADFMIDANITPIPVRFLPASAYTRPFDYYIRFGEYPQTHVVDVTIIDSLNKLAIPTNHQYLINGNPTTTATQTWMETLLDEYALGGEKYVKMATTHPYSTSYNLSTGKSVNAADLWFKVEPLLWFVTNYNDVAAGTTAAMNLLAVNEIIAGIPFHNYVARTGYSTYHDSGVRAFLNGYTNTVANADNGMSIPANAGFLQTAFNATAQDLINSVALNNQTDTSNATTAYTDSGDANAADKIYLPSYNDMTTAPFPATRATGTGNKRSARPTDFAVANYAYYNDKGRLFLRSASSVTNVWCVDSVGAVADNNPHYAYFGLRPAMQISISGLAAVGSEDALTRNIPMDKHVLALEAEVVQLKVDKAAMLGKITQLENDRGTMQAEINTLDTEKSTMQTEIDTLKAAQTAMQKDITDLQTALGNAKTDLEQKIAAAESAAKAALDAEIAALNGTITGLNGQITTLNSAIIGLNSQITTLNGKITGLDGQIADLNTEKDALEDRIETLEADKAVLEVQIADMEDDIKALSKQFTDYMTAHADDYKYGFNDGLLSYMKEYAFVTWKVLLGNEHIGGALTTYALHNKVDTPYGAAIKDITKPDPDDLNYTPAVIPAVSSKQYVYTFAHWSLTPQMGEKPNVAAKLPKDRTATDVIYYAQYTRTERTYNINWIIPAIANDRLDYTKGSAAVITAAYKYGEPITSAAQAEIHGTKVNYIPNGWAATQGGAKVADFGRCTGDRTFYARYIPRQTV
jgi:predicted  nucleic acid-binding Zn-ribbon protein